MTMTKNLAIKTSSWDVGKMRSEVGFGSLSPKTRSTDLTKIRFFLKVGKMVDFDGFDSS